jgi:uncharacterized membrane protein YoaK (UPF0700 family)
MHLATALYVEGDLRRTALRHAALRGGKIFAFTAGAAAGAVLATTVGYFAFFLPAAAVLGATMLSFVNVSDSVSSPSHLSTTK